MNCKSSIPVKNLNQKVTVQTRAMVGSHFGVTDLTEQFIDLSVLWGKFETDQNLSRMYLQHDIQALLQLRIKNGCCMMGFVIKWTG
jgi:hypothetical protein